jgi:hypothetical protein
VYFTLDDNFQRLDWRQPGGEKPTLTEGEAMVVAVAGIAAALDNVAFQLNQALEPLQEIANHLSHLRKE